MQIITSTWCHNDTLHMWHVMEMLIGIQIQTFTGAYQSIQETEGNKIRTDTSVMNYLMSEE